MALAALIVVAVKARAAQVVNMDIPISGAVVNPCNGENVAFSGIDHFSARLTLDGAGGVHADVHDNIHVTAGGDQGNSYVGNQEDHSSFNTRVGAEQTSTFSFSETSRGSAPNFDVYETAHITVNANGTMTVFFDHFRAVCRG